MTKSASLGPKHLRYKWEKPLLYKTSFIRTNCDAWTFNFLAMSFPSGSMLFLRQEISGVVQSLLEPISYTFIPSSMSEETWMNDST